MTKANGIAKVDAQTADARRREVAGRLGLEANKVSVVQAELHKLRKLGLLVRAKVTGVSMFRRAASWAEYGIADGDERLGRFTGGTKILIDRADYNALHSLAVQYRDALNRYSYDVTGFAPYRLVLFTAYDEWKAKESAIRAKGEALKARILARHASNRRKLKSDFQAIAARSWRAIMAQGFDAISIKGKLFETEADFSEYVVARALASFPTPERIEAELVFDYQTAIVADASDLEAEALETARLRARREKAERVAAEASMGKRLAEQEALARIAAMRKAEEEKARRDIEAMGSPLTQVLEDFLAKLAVDAEEILASVNKNGFLKGKVAERAAGLLEWFDIMSVARSSNSDALRGALARLRSEVGAIGAERTRQTPTRNVEAIRQTLETVGELARAEVTEATLDHRFAYLEV